MTAAVTFAFGAGLLSTANPCGFVMLPGFIGLQLRESDRSPRVAGPQRWLDGLGVGLVLSASFSSVLVAAGVVLAAGARSLVDVMPWLAVAVGAVLAIAGATMLLGRPLSVRVPARLRPRTLPTRRYARIAAFGVGYAIASLSCTFAVVLAVAGQATATSDPVQFAATFAAFAAGATSALLALSLSLALASTAVSRGLRALAPVMERLSGVLLLASGLYLLAYWLPQVTGNNDRAGGPITRTLERASSTVSNFLAAHTQTFAIGLAAVVGVGALLVALRRPPA
jgi:cytochrome c-type biogenesis protein